MQSPEIIEQCTPERPEPSQEQEHLGLRYYTLGYLALFTVIAAPVLSMPSSAQSFGYGSCPPLSEEALKTTVTLVDEAQAHPYEEVVVPGDSDWVQTKHNALGAAHGLTVHDYREMFPSRLVDDQEINAIPLEKLVSDAQAFSAQYGISLNLMTEENPFTLASALDPSEFVGSELEYELRRTIHSFVADLSTMPEEYVRSSGVETVHIADLRTIDIGGYMELAGYKEPVIYVNGYNGSGVLHHEVFHAWDYSVTCEEQVDREDPSFSALNPANIYVGRGSSVDQIDIPGDYIAFSDFSFYTEEPSVSDLARAVTVNSYGATSVHEDKATIAEEITKTKTRSGLDRYMEAPVLESKIQNILARFYEEDPALAEYFIDTGFATFSK